MKPNIKNNETGVFAFGGLGEIGKNTYGVQFQDELIILDAGIKFPEDDLLGIDYVIPDYSYIVQNINKVKGLFISHGHEDHIGGIPFLIKQANIPIYATKLAMSLIRNKLEEHGLLRDAILHEIDEDSVIKFRKTQVSFYRTTHSIPDAFGIVIKTPPGNIVFTGDYKFDFTPVGEPANLHRMAQIGSEGVLVLLGDSTNSEVPGFTQSEQVVGKSIKEIIQRVDGRIIFATFASNVSRLKQVTDVAVATGRKLAVFGRSMEASFRTARELGYIKAPDDTFIDGREINQYPSEKVIILCTGSQGEPMAALSRIANGTHRQISIQPGDTVIFSSSPIPGNTSSVNRVINLLSEAGAEVIHGKVNNIHTSGHGSQEEQKLMMLLTKPKYFFPVHGEYRMLKIHAELAEEVGIPKENSFVLSNGDTILLNKGTARLGPRIHVDDIYVDGNDLSGLSTAVLRDRQILSEDGMVSVLISMDSHEGKLLAKPVIISRGFVYMKDSFPMIREAENLVGQALSQLLAGKTTFGEIKNTTRDVLSQYFYRKTKRNPMIIPVIMNKK